MDKDRLKYKDNLIRSAGKAQGICETLRYIYDEVYKLPDGESKDKMTELLVDALIMAKKMSNRLVYYKKTYDDKTGHGGKNVPVIHGINKIREMRQQRSICKT